MSQEHLLNLQSAGGLLALIAVAWLLSEHRRRVPVRLIVAGLGLQLALAALLLKLPQVKGLFLRLNDLVGALQEATQAGTTLVFVSTVTQFSPLLVIENSPTPGCQIS